jgi:hypothetical protein
MAAISAGFAVEEARLSSIQRLKFQRLAFAESRR